MKKIYASIFFLLCVSGIRAQELTSAKDINEYLVAMLDECIIKSDAWTDACGKALETMDFSGLAPLRKDQEARIKKYIAEIEKMDGAFGSTEFRNAALDWLKLQKTIVTMSWPTFETLNSETSEEASDAAIEKHNAYVEQDDVKREAIHQAQEKFADANGLTLEE